MKGLIFAVIASSLLAGCAVNPPMGVLKASKADGSVTVGYLLNGSQPSNFNGSFDAMAKAKADKVCKGWGYTESEDVNQMTLQECSATSWGQCLNGSQSRLFQCKNK